MQNCSENLKSKKKKINSIDEALSVIEFDIFRMTDWIVEWEKNEVRVKEILIVNVYILIINLSWKVFPILVGSL